jgi:hypothetical protein
MVQNRMPNRPAQGVFCAKAVPRKGSLARDALKGKHHRHPLRGTIWNTFCHHFRTKHSSFSHKAFSFWSRGMISFKRAYNDWAYNDWTRILGLNAGNSIEWNHLMLLPAVNTIEWRRSLLLPAVAKPMKNSPGRFKWSGRSRGTGAGPVAKFFKIAEKQYCIW